MSWMKLALLVYRKRTFRTEQHLVNINDADLNSSKLATVLPQLTNAPYTEQNWKKFPKIHEGNEEPNRKGPPKIMKLFSRDESAESELFRLGERKGPNLRGEYDFFGTRPRGKLFLLRATVVSWCCSTIYHRRRLEFPSGRISFGRFYGSEETSLTLFPVQLDHRTMEDRGVCTYIFWYFLIFKVAVWLWLLWSVKEHEFSWFILTHCGL